MLELICATKKLYSDTDVLSALCIRGRSSIAVAIPIYVRYCYKISFENSLKYLNHNATKTHFVRYL